MFNRVVLREKEYDHVMSVVTRFLKEEGYYRLWMDITMRYYDFSKKKHLDEINRRLTNIHLYNLMTNFLSFVPVVSINYEQYGYDKFGVLISYVLANKYKKYCIENRVFNQYL